MALVKCVECGGSISDTAKVCPHCGIPIIRCKECRQMLPQGVETCPHCGAPVDVIYEEEPLPNVQSKPQTKKCFRKGWFALVIVLGMLLFLFVTCPKANQHEKVALKLVDYSMKGLQDSIKSPVRLNAFAELLINRVAKEVLIRNFKVENYGVCSVGKITLEKKQVLVTFGMAGHIFNLVTEKDVQNAIHRLRSTLNQEKMGIENQLNDMNGEPTDDGSSTDETTEDENWLDESRNL